MPQMTGLSEEDWMEPELFPLADTAWTTGGATVFIQLRNPRHNRDEFDLDLWKYASRSTCFYY